MPIRQHQDKSRALPTDRLFAGSASMDKGHGFKPV